MTTYATELDAARAVASGEAKSPLRYENCWLYAIRITGTGVSFRVGRKEYVFRTPEVFLTEEFADRCAGLPVILVHPEKALLDAEEYVNRNVGAVMFAYQSDDEIWGIARIFDDDVVEAMRSGDLSTSPGVRFDPDEIATAQIDEDSLAIEGNPKLVDHIAVVPAGVWDKGGPPTGIRNDAMAEEDRSDSKFSELVDKLVKEGHSKESATKIAAKIGDEKYGAHEMAEKAAESRAHNRSDGKDEPMAEEDKGDGARQDAAKDLMDKLDALCSRMDAIGARMDAVEKDRKDSARADAEEDKDEDKKDAKRADESEEKREEDERKGEEKAEEDKKDSEEDKKERDEKDAAVAQNKALADQIAAMQARIDALSTPRPVEDMDRLARAQNRADGILQMLGERPVQPWPSESSMSYRKRVLAGLKKHSEKLKDVAVDALDGAAFDTIETAIYNDAQAAAVNPVNAPVGRLIEMKSRDDAGRTVTRYAGDIAATFAPWMAKPMRGRVSNPRRGGNA